MGMKGKKNCRVIGKTSDVRSSVAMAVLTNGAGVSIMLKQKMPRMARRSHCPSRTDHLCSCNARTVSTGETEVCRAEIEDAGDCLPFSFDRIFRRNLCGTNNAINFHGTLNVVLLYASDQEDLGGMLTAPADAQLIREPSWACHPSNACADRVA